MYTSYGLAGRTTSSYFSVIGAVTVFVTLSSQLSLLITVCNGMPTNIDDSLNVEDDNYDVGGAECKSLVEKLTAKFNAQETTHLLTIQQQTTKIAELEATIQERDAKILTQEEQLRKQAIEGEDKVPKVLETMENKIEEQIEPSPHEGDKEPEDKEPEDKEHEEVKEPIEVSEEKATIQTGRTFESTEEEEEDEDGETTTTTEATRRRSKWARPRTNRRGR